MPYPFLDPGTPLQVTFRADGIEVRDRLRGVVVPYPVSVYELG